MTPKEHAIDIFSQFVPYSYTGDEKNPSKRTKLIIHNAKKIAITHVHGILDALYPYEEAEKTIHHYNKVLEEIKNINSL